jgi:lysophospholipase L1-like esterase
MLRGLGLWPPRCSPFARTSLVVAMALEACHSGVAGPGQGPDAGATNPPGSDASGVAVETGGPGDSGGEDAGAVGDSWAGGGGGPADAGGDGGGIVAGGVRWVGRVDSTNASAVKFAWSGAGFVATVSGSKISVVLQTEGATTSSAFFQPVVDGTAGPRLQVMKGAAQTVVIANALAAGDHTVELYRESEGMYGDSIFSGFVDGNLKGAPAASGRLIEIIGDSISAGYGNLGSEIHPPWTNTCSFSLDTESAYQAYGSMIGRALNAEVSIIARSGWGMYRDGSGNTAGVLSLVYENTLGTQSTPKWDFKRQADAVLINLGTNDVGQLDGGQGDPGQPYEDAYVAFLRTVRGHYPNAWIFLTMGPMTSDPLLSQLRTHITNVVSKVGDAKITAVNIATQDATMTGCDYHPNVAEDNVMANVLATAVKAKLGW